MGKFSTWIQKQIDTARSYPLWRLFLTGLKGQIDTKNPKPYNFYIKIMTAGASLLMTYYFLLFRKN